MRTIIITAVFAAVSLLVLVLATLAVARDRHPDRPARRREPHRGIG